MLSRLTCDDRQKKDARQPMGNNPGVIMANQEKRRGKPKATARSQRQSGKSGKKNGKHIGGAVEECREEGIVRHSELPKAHTDSVMSIIIAEDCIYTASRDKTLKRWKVGRNPGGRFELQHEFDVPLGVTCLCMCSVGEWLFCGLGSGAIRGFSTGTRTGFLLSAHSKRCSTLLVHEAVLLSGGADASVKCWMMDPSTQMFNNTHSITEGLCGATNCLSVLDGHLWVGGLSGISIIQMETFKVVHQVMPNKSVAGFLVFQGHIIVSYSDGTTCYFDTAGQQKHTLVPLPSGPVLCIAGLETGPRLLCGHAKGQVSSVGLPMMDPRAYWQAFERCKVQSIACAGHDGIFIIGGENGALQIWQSLNGGQAFFSGTEGHGAPIACQYSKANPSACNASG